MSPARPKPPRARARPRRAAPARPALFDAPARAAPAASPPAPAGWHCDTCRKALSTEAHADAHRKLKHAVRAVRPARAAGHRARSVALSAAAGESVRRLATGNAGLDRVLGGGIVTNSVVLLTGKPGIGKCVAGDTRVLDPATGEYAPIRELVARGRATVLAVDPVTLRTEARDATSFHANGLREVVELTTALGRRLRATPNHPMLTPDGWRPLGELRSGDRVAAPRRLHHFGSRSMPHHEVLFLAYYIGDGSGVGAMVDVCASEPGIARDLEAVAEGFGCRLSKYPKAGSDSASFRFVGGPRGPAPRGLGPTGPAMLLERLGLRHLRSAEKFIPDELFELREDLFRDFAKALFSTDGSVHVGVNGDPALSYGSTSERLARGVQHLLLRLGFVASLRTRHSRYRGDDYVHYAVELQGVEEVRRFLDEVGMHGREGAQRAVRAMPQPTRPSTRKDIVPTGAAFWRRIDELNEAKGDGIGLQRRTGVQSGASRGRTDNPVTRMVVRRLATGLGDARLAALADGDVYWDEVAAVTPAGEEDVFDLTVPGLANFVAEDLFVHNSTILAEVSGYLGSSGRAVLYITGEEVAGQVGDRAKRLGVPDGRVRILSTNSLEEVVEEIGALAGTPDDPDLIIVDSAQVLHTLGVSGQAGSPPQLREVAATFVRIAKRETRAVVLVGHVTKEGDTAGPEVMIHLVDVELVFGNDENDRRFLRAPKNRYGSAGEVASYDMTARGLVACEDATLLVLEDLLGPPDGDGEVGVVPFAATHLAQPVLLGVEASALPVAPDSSRTVSATGFPAERLKYLLERLSFDLSLDLSERSIRVKVPRVVAQNVDDTGLDLAVTVAVLSAVFATPPPRGIVFGEVGLSGKIGPVPRAEQRLQAALAQAKRLGLTRAIVPQRTAAFRGLELVRVAHVNQLVGALWPQGTRQGPPEPRKKAEAA